EAELLRAAAAMTRLRLVSCGPRHENADRKVCAGRNRNCANMRVPVFRGALNEVTRHKDLYWSGVHYHATIWQEVDLVDLPAILASATPQRIPRVSVRLVATQHHRQGGAKGNRADDEPNKDHGNFRLIVQRHSASAPPNRYHQESRARARGLVAA